MNTETMTHIVTAILAHYKYGVVPRFNCDSLDGLEVVDSFGNFIPLETFLTDYTAIITEGYTREREEKNVSSDC